MKKYIFLLLFIGVAFAQTPDWSTSVASIIYNNCTSCHRQGGLGPFALESYQDAVFYADDIYQSVESKNMPPWPPDPSYKHFKNELSLEDSEISAILDWIDMGTPRGDSTLEPALPTFASGSQLSQIDQTISTPNYTVGSSSDSYRTYVVASGLSSDAYLNGLEVMPGNGAVVHHVIVYYDPSQQTRLMDLSDPGPGFASFGLGPIAGTARWITAWAPGAGVFEFPANMGVKIPAGSDLAIEVHYAPGVQGQTDQTSVNLNYISTPNIREVYVDPTLFHGEIIGNPSTIPANTVTVFEQQKNWGLRSLIAVFPHMHQIAKDYILYSTHNQDTIQLCHIPRWKFHWQAFYTYQMIQVIPNNSKLHCKVTYDNTVNNPDNPSSPPQDVSLGENTNDEMMLTINCYVDYQVGDENVILDSTLLNTNIPVQEENAHLSLFPNPSSDYLNIQFPAQVGADISLEIFDREGKKVRSFYQTMTTETLWEKKFDIQNLSKGIYFVKLSSDKYQEVLQFVKD